VDDSSGDSRGKTKPDGHTETLSSRGKEIGFPNGNRGITHLRLCSCEPSPEIRWNERSGCPLRA